MVLAARAAGRPIPDLRFVRGLTNLLRHVWEKLHGAGIGSLQPMSTLELDLRSVKGFLVADVRGRVIGRVESPMYGTQPDRPDALAVRSGFLRGRRLVPAEAIGEIDEGTRVIALSVLP